eukprot:SAG11_NODE_19445_length_466_cov_1.125341_2_plen_70_part_01
MTIALEAQASQVYEAGEQLLEAKAQMRAMRDRLLELAACGAEGSCPNNVSCTQRRPGIVQRVSRTPRHSV